MRAQPLANLRVAVTRQSERAEALAAQLRELGATTLICPAIRIAPLENYAALDAALEQLASFDWLVVTSASTVAQLTLRMAERTLPTALRVAAVGPATAAALHAAGWRVDLVPPTSVAEALLAALGAVQGQRILLPQADIARPVLADGLRAAGAEVTALAAYRTLADPRAGELAKHLAAGAVDVVLFTSASTVRATWAALEDADASALLESVALASIGPITSAALRALGGQVALEAASHTLDGLIEALQAWHQRRLHAAPQ